MGAEVFLHIKSPILLAGSGHENETITIKMNKQIWEEQDNLTWDIVAGRINSQLNLYDGMFRLDRNLVRDAYNNIGADGKRELEIEAIDCPETKPPERVAPEISEVRNPNAGRKIIGYRDEIIPESGPRGDWGAASVEKVPIYEGEEDDHAIRSPNTVS